MNTPWYADPLTYLWIVLGILFLQFIWSLWRRRLCFMEFSGGDDDAACPLPASVLRALIRVEVHRLAAIAQMPDGRPLRFDLACPYEDHYDLGSATDGLPPVWKQVVAVLALIISQFGSRARVVTGMLLPRERVILGIETIHGGVKRTDTIRAEDLEFPPDPQQDGLAQLALPAAAWIILSGYPGTTLAGTPDWQSYVDFAAGFAWQLRGQPPDLAEARRLYARACRDPRNTAAAVNLAAMEQVDEHQAGAPPADPRRRPSARRLTRVVEVTAQRRRDEPRAEASSPDLQWYRSRYLLSTGLRDGVDRTRAAEPGLPSDQQSAVSVAADEALGYAVDLALRMENERRILPADFTRYGRAAALTLVARQAFPTLTGENADQVAVAGQDRQDLTPAGLRAELRRLKPKQGRPDTGPGAEPGTAELLVRFVRTRLPTDDQTEYNLMQYQRTRARIIRTAVERWDGVMARELGYWLERGLALPDDALDWQNSVQRWQRLLARQYLIAERDADESMARVEESADPILRGLVTSPEERETASYAREEGAERIRYLAREGDALSRATSRDLKPPEEHPFFDPRPSPDSGPTRLAPRRGPDGPAA